MRRIVLTLTLIGLIFLSVNPLVWSQNQIQSNTSRPRLTPQQIQHIQRLNLPNTLQNYQSGAQQNRPQETLPESGQNRHLDETTRDNIQQKQENKTVYAPAKWEYASYIETFEHYSDAWVELGGGGWAPLEFFWQTKDAHLRATSLTELVEYGAGLPARRRGHYHPSAYETELINELNQMGLPNAPLTPISLVPHHIRLFSILATRGQWQLVACGSGQGTEHELKDYHPGLPMLSGPVADYADGLETRYVSHCTFKRKLR